jgi:hypothetical protein
VTQNCPNALQTVLDEFKNLSPETTNALIFKNNGQTIANTQATTETQTKKLILNFGSIASQAQSIEGIETLTIQAADSQLNITAIDNFYLATVSSREANQKIVKSLTQVLVPTIVRLVDQVGSVPKENPVPQTVQPQEPRREEAVLPVEDEPSIEPIPEPQGPFEPIPPSTPINQFMVEKIGGLLVAADTVRIDGDVLDQWSELYGGKQFTMVNIEALDGKKTTCKFKAIKEAKNSAKGVIQIPEKILQTLQTEKGKLVMVKPVVE